MAADQRVVDEATTVQMLSSFDQANTECRQIGGQVEASAASLLAQWTGVAAQKYGQSITQWQDGLAKVRSGLDLLNGNMTTYRTTTSRAEEANTHQAGNWASV